MNKQLTNERIIVDGVFCSIWDDGITVETKCKINILTRQVIDIERIDPSTLDEDLDILQTEYVLIDEEPFNVYEESDERLYDTDCEDFDISKPVFWY